MRQGAWPSPPTLAAVLALLAALLVLPLALAPARGSVHLLEPKRRDQPRQPRWQRGGSSCSSLARVRSQEFGDVAVDGEHIYWTGPAWDRARQARRHRASSRASSRGIVDATWHEPCGRRRARLLDPLLLRLHQPATDPTAPARSAAPTSTAPASIRTFIDDVIAGDVAVDTRFIYWTNLGPANTPATTDTPDTIGRAKLDGTGADPGFISVPSGEAPQIHGLAVDAEHIYWTQSGPASAATAPRRLHRTRRHRRNQRRAELHSSGSAASCHRGRRRARLLELGVPLDARRPRDRPRQPRRHRRRKALIFAAQVGSVQSTASPTPSSRARPAPRGPRSSGESESASRSWSRPRSRSRSRRAARSSSTPPTS